MIATLLSIETMRHLNEFRPALLVLLILSALAVCFSGYVLFRLVLVILALIGGALLGMAIASRLQAVPNGLDYFVACFTCAIVFVLLAWFLSRLAFAACTATAVAALIAVAALDRPDSGGAWVFGGVVGLTVGVYAFMHTRLAFVFLSSLSGSFIAVFATAALVVEPTGGQQTALLALPAQRWAVAALSVISVALGGAGVYVQSRLSQSVRLALMPQDQLPGRSRSGKVRKRSRTSTRVRPPFTRV